MKSSDELNRALSFVDETIALLKNQIETVTIRDRGHKATERLDLLEWYQQYADWLRGLSAEFDLELSDYFSRRQAGIPWTVRYEEIANGYQKLAEDIGGIVEKWEEEKKKIEARMQKLNTAVLERRILADRDDLELARELWAAYREKSYDTREIIYKELSDAEVLYVRSELKSADEQQKYFECLTELAKYEEAWLLIKAGDFRKSSEIAAVINGSEPSAVIYAVRSTITTYEASMKSLKRRSGEIYEKNRALPKSGTLKTLDRMEELSRYYEKMRTRYERHIEWLRSQMGSYEADLIELRKELSQK